MGKLTIGTKIIVTDPDIYTEFYDIRIGDTGVITGTEQVSRHDPKLMYRIRFDRQDRVLKLWPEEFMSHPSIYRRIK